MIDQETARVSRFEVSTLAGDELVDGIARLALIRDRPTAAFALHVGGLAHHNDDQVVAAYGCADITYADGAGTVVAARLAGGPLLSRSATTDIGEPVLHRVAGLLGRPVRLALVGGETGLSERAGRALVARGGVATVMSTSGFHEDWAPVIAQLRAADPDVVLVGLGCPLEMQWFKKNRGQLPQALYLTCGGWFKFLAGDERRAPSWMQRFGLEWTYRIAHDPRGKLGRYVNGVGHVISAGMARRPTD